MADIYIKSDTMLPITREMKIKTPMRYHLTIFRMSMYKRAQKTNVGKDVEKRELLYTVRGNVIWCSHCGKQYRISSKI